MGKNNREKVYEAINSERDYQDSKWGDVSNENYVEYPPSQYLIDIEIHLNKAKLANYNIDKNGVMDEIRKIAALCVKCGEVHSVNNRK